ncbi:MAG: methionyl-tRNA formyltransferase [Hyphomicrobiales bacterium]|nr:methionyl-tRNA formyltransferase [Hyphomicrobiales bacterium]
MKLVFMGTPDFAVVTLKALAAAGHEIAAVYSQPPRPAGRGQNVRPSPVQDYAVAQGFEVRTPLSLKSADEQKAFADLNADAAVVVAYGLLLPQVVLDAPRFGCFNVHASLLPRWRGAAPIQRAIMAGDAQSGVTIMRMKLGLDTGPMMKVGHVPVSAETTASSLHDELAVLGAKLMVEVLQHPENPGTPQPAEGVTYAKKIDKAETKIDFTRPAVEVRNHIHGLAPFPGAWCSLAGARVKILKAQAVDHAGDEALTFACSSGAIKFLLLQREGKGVMDAATFLRGFPLAPDTKPA